LVVCDGADVGVVAAAGAPKSPFFRFSPAQLAHDEKKVPLRGTGSGDVALGACCDVSLLIIYIMCEHKNLTAKFTAIKNAIWSTRYIP